MRRIALAAAAIVGACTGDLALSPAATAARADRTLAAELDRQLVALPGIAGAVTRVERGGLDPLSTTARPPRASVALSLSPAATSATPDDARRLIAAAVPPLAPADVVVAAASAPRPATLARVGPFAVAPATRGPLAATLAALLALVAAGGLAIARRAYARRGIRPQ